VRKHDYRIDDEFPSPRLKTDNGRRTVLQTMGNSNTARSDMLAPRSGESSRSCRTCAHLLRGVCRCRSTAAAARREDTGLRSRSRVLYVERYVHCGRICSQYQTRGNPARGRPEAAVRPYAADGHTNNVSEGFPLLALLACADTQLSGHLVRGSGADCWHAMRCGVGDYMATCMRGLSDHPPAKHSLSPVSRLPYCRRPKGSAPACVEMDLRTTTFARDEPRAEVSLARSSHKEVHPHVLPLQ